MSHLQAYTKTHTSQETFIFTNILVKYRLNQRWLHITQLDSVMTTMIDHFSFVLGALNEVMEQDRLRLSLKCVLIVREKCEFSHLRHQGVLGRLHPCYYNNTNTQAVCSRACIRHACVKRVMYLFVSVFWFHLLPVTDWQPGSRHEHWVDWVTPSNRGKRAR